MCREGEGGLMVIDDFERGIRGEGLQELLSTLLSFGGGTRARRKGKGEKGLGAKLLLELLIGEHHSCSKCDLLQCRFHL